MTGLFSPLQIKNLTLKNRIALPPMANSLSDDSGAVTDKHIKHYVRRAEAGVGMVIVEHAYVRRDGRVDARQLGIHDDALVPGLRRLAEAVKACDTVVGIQITHGGGKATQATAGGPVLAPAEGIIPGGAEPAVALSTSQIAEIVAAFAAGARRALDAGFDFVEIHGAHGYLLSQFLSPLTNPGSLEGRLRAPLQVVKAVRALVDDDHLLLYRLGASDYMPGGLTEAEGRRAAGALAAAGVDMLDVSGGLNGSQPPDWDKKSQGYFVPMAAGVRAEAKVPVVVAGGITDPHAADRFIREGQVDMVAIGRAMLVNPDWAARARAALDADA
ncbi:MAG: NADH:flavin oxidoreductase [Anaerolineae bacterium]|nr:NADH:flavin oxidoreductase [Anaerolineae bacterium]